MMRLGQEDENRGCLKKKKSKAQCSAAKIPFTIHHQPGDVRKKKPKADALRRASPPSRLRALACFLSTHGKLVGDLRNARDRAGRQTING